MTDLSHDPQQDTVRARMEAMIVAMRRQKARSAAANDDEQQLAAVAAPERERSVAEPSGEANATAILESGVRIGRYMILRVLGAGGMGVVYAAYDPELDRRIALKLVRPGMAGEHERARLLREAMALAKLSHPNVVAIHDVGTAGEQVWLAMELVRGRTLRQWQSDRPRSWRSCLAVYVQAGEALAAAHAAGLVHRDFKPDNCIVDPAGRLRVLDFGLAGGAPARPSRETEDDEGVELEHPHDDLTAPGTIMGTPGYMSPEQWAGELADARSDQFSFCVSLYEAVYGERPFEGGSVPALASAIDRGQVRPVPQGLPARVPAALRTILVRGLAGRPDDRWPSMEILLGQLQRLVVPRARRWALISLAVGVLGAGGGLALGRVVEELERCTDAHRRLTNIWDDGRRQDVKAAILATGLSYAPGTWERVEQRLDDYADAWASKHTEVCEASTADAQGEEDRRLRLDCMHERSRALRAAVDVLTQADEQVVENAVRLVAGLPGFDRCDDLAALRAVVPPPEDPEVRREVEALREQLADIEAEEKAGDYVHALEEVERVVERAEALGYGALIAEAKYRRGSVREKNGRYAEAEQDLQEAYELAMEHRHDEVAMGTATGLTYVVGYVQARHAEGRVWGEVSLAHAKRSGEDFALANSLSNLGNVLDAQGEYEQAKLGYEQALLIREKALGADHPDVATSLNNLGIVLHFQGEYEHSQLQFERALRIREKTLGADHPHVADSLNNLGSVLRTRGEYEQARLQFERSLQVREKALRGDHPDVAAALVNLGTVLDTQGEYEQAQLHYERALRMKEKALGADHPDVATILNNLGIVLQTQGEYEQAQLHLERALRIYEEALGADHPDVANVLRTLGEVLALQGQYEQAQLHIERALRTFEKALSAEHPDVAASLHSLGVVLYEQGEYEQAQLRIERALRICEDALGADHSGVAAMLHSLGSVLYEQGEHEQAQRHFERALQIREDALGVDHPDVAYPLAGLAEVMLAQERFDTARTHAERAVALREKADVAPELLAEARFVLARALWSAPAAQGRDRPRARTLAEQARDAYAGLGEAQKTELAEVQAWLAEHHLP